MNEQAIDLVKMRAYECAKIIIDNRNIDALAKLIIKHEALKAREQALRETLKEIKAWASNEGEEIPYSRAEKAIAEAIQPTNLEGME